MLRIANRLTSKFAARKCMSTTAAAAPESYSVPVQFFHWTMGFFLCTATGAFVINRYSSRADILTNNILYFY